jgi:DUF971 family protein
VTPDITPIRLNLVKDRQLEIDWQDGKRSVYAIAYLRSLCPCAQCKIVREGEKDTAGKKKSLLTILPGNYSRPLTAVGAELVGNYALRIDWSDDHGSGIYSFRYLRDISPEHVSK